MLNKEEIKYYNRQLLLGDFNQSTQLLLKKAKVLVVGAGGLGCPTLQYLVGAGVGNIGIVDGDKVEESNLHRQVLYGVKDIGKNKAQVAYAKLKDMNPHVNFRVFDYHLNTENALRYIVQYDIIIDATDNFASRYMINDACITVKKPFVYGAIEGFNGQVSFFNLPNGPTYRCLYPEPPAPENAPNCNENGVLGILPGIIGNYQALEVIKWIINKGELLKGKLLLFNALSFSHQILPFQLNSENKFINGLLDDYKEFCGLTELNKEELQDNLINGNWVGVDLRNPEEYKMNGLKETINIPLNDLMKKQHTLSKDKTTILICNTGNRSGKAKKTLEEIGFKDLKIYRLE